MVILGALSAILLISPQFLNSLPALATTATAPADVRTTGPASGSVPCNTQSGQGATLTFNAQGISADGTTAAITRGTWEIKSSTGQVLYNGQFLAGGFNTSPEPGRVLLEGSVNTNNCGTFPARFVVVTHCGTGQNIVASFLTFMGNFVGNVQCTIADTKQECKNIVITKEGKKECKDLPSGRSGSQG